MIARDTHLIEQDTNRYTLEDAARARGTTASRLDWDRLTPYELELIAETNTDPRCYVVMPDGERIGPYTRYVVQDVRHTLSAEQGQLLTIEYEAAR